MGGSTAEAGYLNLTLAQSRRRAARAIRWQAKPKVVRPCSQRHLGASSKTECHGLCLYLCHTTKY